jgi:hypothetical protein
MYFNAIKIQKVILQGEKNTYNEAYDVFIEDRASDAVKWLQGKEINLIKPYKK